MTRRATFRCPAANVCDNSASWHKVTIRSPTEDRGRKAFTIIELLVVLSVIGLVMALTLSAVQSARETSRRSQCASNLRQIGIAISSYHDAFRSFPPGSSKTYSLHAAILPYVEQSPVYGLVDYRVWWSDPANVAARSTVIPTYLCPSDGVAAGQSVTNYAGNYGAGVGWFGYNGVFGPLIQPNGQILVINTASIRDGLSQTSALADILVAGAGNDPERAVFDTPVRISPPAPLDDFADLCAAQVAPGSFGANSRGSPWLRGDVSVTGYVHVLPPNQNNCTNFGSVQDGAYTASSMHPGGVQLVFADGHVDFVADSIDRTVWRGFGSRNGGEATR